MGHAGQASREALLVHFVDVETLVVAGVQLVRPGFGIRFQALADLRSVERGTVLWVTKLLQ